MNTGRLLCSAISTEDGQLHTLPSSYCQRTGAGVSIPALRTSALDVVSIYLSDDGLTWYADYSVGAGGAPNNNLTFALRDGAAELYASYVVSSAKQYQIVIRPADRRLTGQVPATVSDAVFDPMKLPSASFFWTYDGAQSYSSDYEYCSGGDSFVITAGKLALPSTYCTSGASQYQIALRNEGRRYTGHITAWPVKISDAALHISSLPNLSIYWSNDGGKSYSASYTLCSGGRSFLIQEGVLTLNSTYCTNSATDYVLVIDG